ncbi:cytochrome P450 714C2-like [Senna tora]|uniref:Cytochrome P450 714C2-like n=1 Tax=Senna tora TaxID=362788 RepID=A0A834WQ09_9FABA|nr:cytochrome P450 714C2-like [Senna tora]
MVTDVGMVKEVSLYTALNLGKPSYLSKDRGALLGQGILSSSGQIWAHQRKIIAPQLYLDKVKSTNIMVKSWESRLESEGAVLSEIKADEDLRSLSADIITRASFGSNYAKGQEIFTKLRHLQKVMSTMTARIPDLGRRESQSENGECVVDSSPLLPEWFVGATAVDFVSALHSRVPRFFFSERGESSALVFITHSIHSLYTTIVATRRKRTTVTAACHKGIAIGKPSLNIGECSSSSYSQIDEVAHYSILFVQLKVNLNA